LLKEIPIEDKEKDIIISRIDEFFKITKGIRAKDELELLNLLHCFYNQLHLLLLFLRHHLKEMRNK
jgi:hypothetical protein